MLKRFKIIIKKLCGDNKTEPYKIEQYRNRGVVIGDNFDACDSAIDYYFGHLVTIGDNVTITGTTILAHDASTKKSFGI